MPVSKYRMFRMDGEFDRVSLGGHEVSPEVPQGKVEAEKETIGQKVGKVIDKVVGNA
jgi:hypothetical protein